MHKYVILSSFKEIQGGWMLYNDYDTMLHIAMHITSEGVGLDYVNRASRIEEKTHSEGYLDP